MTCLAERVAARTAAISLGAALLLHAPAPQAAETPVPPYRVAGDAIPAPLAGAAGDAARGRAIVLDRRTGLCLLCHSGPFPAERFQGNLGPDLAGIGSRLSEGQIRLRIVDPERLRPDSIMPAYYRSSGQTRVAAAFRGKPVLNAQQIEDVVAFLATLRKP